MDVTFSLNGRLLSFDTPPHWTLLRLLRDQAGATEVRHGCGEGVCGACAVILDGVGVASCTILAPQVAGSDVVTVAGLGSTLHPLQRELLERGAVQCGFCTGGMIIAGIEAVRAGTANSPSEIRQSLVGNLCRCTGYHGIVESIEAFQRKALT